MSAVEVNPADIAAMGRQAAKSKATRELPFCQNRADHLQLARRIFYDSTVSDKQMQEAIYTVHCMLTGIVIQMVLEPRTFDPGSCTHRLKSILQAILY
jgi:hypothetical protein